MNNLVPDEALRGLALYSGEPWTQQNPYHAMAEAHMAWCWENLIWPFISDCDFTHTLDLACGSGRNSTMLVPLATTHVMMDILADNVAACRERFTASHNVNYYVCNGYDMQPVQDGSLTLAYCFDAMVHFDSDVVRSYLHDTYRVLKPGGRGFFHHSAQPLGPDWRQILARVRS